MNISPAVFRFKCHQSHGKIARPEPPGTKLQIDENFEYELKRRVEFSGNERFLVDRLCDDFGSFVLSLLDCLLTINSRSPEPESDNGATQHIYFASVITVE